MKLRAYKYALVLCAALSCFVSAKAQDTLVVTGKQGNLSLRDRSDLKQGIKQLELAMNGLNRNLNEGLKNLDEQLGPVLKNLGENINEWVNEDKFVQGAISEKVKTYSKSYPLDANDKLRIDTKFGKVIVNTWNKPEVKVEVNIHSYANSDEIAQKMIDGISISDHKEGDVVSFNTSFGSSNSIWDGLFKNQNDHHKVEVDYTVYLPSKNALDINNSYGSTELPDFEGKLNIIMSYGSFTGKALSHPDNRIAVRYGSAAIGKLSSADLVVSYGSLMLDAADQLNGEFRYGSVKIGRISTKGNINAHYAGNVTIDDLDKNFSSFSYSGSYSNLKVGVNNATNADFDITVKYGEFKYGDAPVTITEKTPSDEDKGWKPTKNFRGHIGKGSSDRVINISSNYGGVSFL